MQPRDQMSDLIDHRSLEKSCFWLTWYYRDGLRTTPEICSKAFPPLLMLCSCWRGSLKYQSLQFSHGPVSESGIYFEISGLGEESGSGGHTALPGLFEQKGGPPEKNFISYPFNFPVTSSSSRCWPALALESTRSKSVPPAAYSIAIT